MRISYEIVKVNKQIEIKPVGQIKGIEVLAMFLNTDILAFEKWLKELFDKVIWEHSSCEKISCDVCSLKIEKKTTNIYDMQASDEEYYSTSCEVDTRDLRELIEEWCVKVHEFRSEQKLIQQFKECREKYLYFKKELEDLYLIAKENPEDKSVYGKIGMLFEEWLDFSENEYAAVIFRYGIGKKLVLRINSTEECKLWKDIFGTEFEVLTKEKRHMLIELVEKQSEYSVCNEINF